MTSKWHGTEEVEKYFWRTLEVVAVADDLQLVGVVRLVARY
jgi:predicted DNA-binding ribbon-helix-helix protein